MSQTLVRLRRIFQKSPSYLTRRISEEIVREFEVFTAPLRHRRLNEKRLARTFGGTTVNELWQQFADAPSPFKDAFGRAETFAERWPDEAAKTLKKAAAAMTNTVDLLGSGEIRLGDKVSDIQWNQDYKTGISWPNRFFRRINYNNPERPSDVKFPWEISRMQWMIPLGQAYQISGDEKYAEKARDLIADWIAKNPFAYSVNWACTMDVAMRAMTWTWFFHAFSNSTAWQDDGFRFAFLKALFQHGDFTERHLERADINGNHYTADAAGLVFCGLFFAGKGPAGKWLREGREILEAEIPLQVFEDGVDFEASVPYHRLVQEFFLLAAIYLDRCGETISAVYRDRLKKMAEFTTSYSRPDGSVPMWGDADDARALPFGNQTINDHRYVVAVAGRFLDGGDASPAATAATASELFWTFGEISEALSADLQAANETSRAFPDGGVFIMRNEVDHIFIDCGPLGLAGRGGHGHNDLLSFEAVLNGQRLISDSGSYLYTASYEERNNFRSTAYHNTPQVDGEEINRFIAPDILWFLHNDAEHDLRLWHMSAEQDVFAGAHNGFARLPQPVTVLRRISLEHAKHKLVVEDRFEGQGEHDVCVPLHLAPGVAVEHISDTAAELSAGGKSFTLRWTEAADWKMSVEAGRVSESYGKVEETVRLVWRRSGDLRPLGIEVEPDDE